MNSGEKKGTLAVLALIFGITGIIITWLPRLPMIGPLGIALSIAAIVMGAIKLVKIKKGQTSASGRGFAVSGIVLGALTIVGWIVVSIVFLIIELGSFQGFSL